MAKYYKRSPDQLTTDEVQNYLAHLFQERKLSWSTCNQAAHAFRFLYHVTLGHDRAHFVVPAPRQPCSRVRDRLLFATTYAAGLRVSEVVHLKVSDLDGPPRFLPPAPAPVFAIPERPAER